MLPVIVVTDRKLAEVPQQLLKRPRRFLIIGIDTLSAELRDLMTFAPTAVKVDGNGVVQAVSDPISDFEPIVGVPQ